MLTLVQKKMRGALILVGASLSWAAMAGPLPVQQLPAELDRCGRFAPVNGEPYRWVQMDMDVSQLFASHATAAGHAPGGNAYWDHTTIPAGFVAQKQTSYCSSFIDPAGFPHHISQARTCTLQLSSQHVGGGNQQVVATLKYSGCYLKSSTRKPNKLQAASSHLRH